MNHIRYQPREFFRDMSDQMNRLMSGRLDTLLLPEETPFSEKNWVPAVDIKEEPERFLQVLRDFLHRKEAAPAGMV